MQNETNRSSRSVIATNTASHLSISSELSELDCPFCCNDSIDYKFENYEFHLYNNNGSNSIIVDLVPVRFPHAGSTILYVSVRQLYLIKLDSHR